MAIQLVSAIKRYIGTAAEVATFSLVGLPVGSTFFESDTGQLKILSAAGTLVNAPSESVSLSGSIVEYAWFTGAEQPIPADQTKFAWGYEFDETTGEISAYGWSGTAWVKVVI